MRPKKYTDFTETDLPKRIAKHLPSGQDDLRVYVSIACPHCKVAFAEVAKDSLYGNKSSVCLAHLRGNPDACPPVPPCAAAIAAGVTVSARKPRREKAPCAQAAPKPELVQEDAEKAPMQEPVARDAPPVGVPVAASPLDLQRESVDLQRESNEIGRESNAIERERNEIEWRKLELELWKAQARGDRWKAKERQHHANPKEDGYSSPCSSDSSAELEVKRCHAESAKKGKVLDDVADAIGTTRKRSAESVDAFGRRVLGKVSDGRRSAEMLEPVSTALGVPTGSRGHSKTALLNKIQEIQKRGRGNGVTFCPLTRPVEPAHEEPDPPALQPSHPELTRKQKTFLKLGKAVDALAKDGGFAGKQLLVAVHPDKNTGGATSADAARVRSHLLNSMQYK